MPRTLTITQDIIGTMTVADLELLEDRTGRPLSRLFDADAPRGALLHSLAYIVLRRDEPAITWEDAGDVVVDLEADAEVVSSTADPTPHGRKRRGA